MKFGHRSMNVATTFHGYSLFLPPEVVAATQPASRRRPVNQNLKNLHPPAHGPVEVVSFAIPDLRSNLASAVRCAGHVDIRCSQQSPDTIVQDPAFCPRYSQEIDSATRISNVP